MVKKIKVEIKIFSENKVVNLELNEGIKLLEILKDLKISFPGHLIILNSKFLDMEEIKSYSLKEDCKINILPAIEGG